jgi:hypothetical protein
MLWEESVVESEGEDQTVQSNQSEPTNDSDSGETVVDQEGDDNIDHQLGEVTREQGDPGDPDVTLDTNSAELKKAQVDDPTLTPLWELADRQGENMEGYYVSSPGGLLMYKEQPKQLGETSPRLESKSSDCGP